MSAGWEVGLGLAWSPRGDELWFTGTKGDLAPSLHAVPASGGLERLLARAPQPLLLHDVFRDGRALVSSASLRGGISCLVPGETEERELGWLDWSWVEGLSRDGRLVLFSEEHAGGAPKGAVYLRATDGSPAVRLGDGNAEGLSPDGRWALTKPRERPQWVLLPTGAGDRRTLPQGNFVALIQGDWLPDARRIVFSAREEGGAVRVYVQDIEDGALRPLTPPGVDIRLHAATPDGKYVTAWTAGKHLLFPVDGGEPRPIPYLTPDDSPVQWSADGRFLFVRTRGDVPAQIDRIDMKSGSREPWKTLSPRDPSGIERVYPIVITPDGRAYCYSYARTLNDLYLVEGLR